MSRSRCLIIPFHAITHIYICISVNIRHKHTLTHIHDLETQMMTMMNFRHFIHTNILYVYRKRDNQLDSIANAFIISEEVNVKGADGIGERNGIKLTHIRESCHFFLLLRVVAWSEENQIKVKVKMKIKHTHFAFQCIRSVGTHVKSTYVTNFYDLNISIWHGGWWFMYIFLKFVEMWIKWKQKNEYFHSHQLKRLSRWYSIWLCIAEFLR